MTSINEPAPAGTPARHREELLGPYLAKPPASPAGIFRDKKRNIRHEQVKIIRRKKVRRLFFKGSIIIEPDDHLDDFLVTDRSGFIIHSHDIANQFLDFFRVPGDSHLF